MKFPLLPLLLMFGTAFMTCVPLFTKALDIIS